MLEALGLQITFAPPGGAPVRAVDDVSISVETGSLFTMLGPSGCGKTTTLRAIAGLEQPSAGVIRSASRTYLDHSKGIFVPPSHRDIGMVFQSYAIWPHMNAFENVAFPLRAPGSARKYGADDLKKKVRHALEMVDLAGYEERPANKLSGGQQQRLAFARALVMEPELLLLDEPLSNLDAKLRETMRFELKHLQQRLGITTIYVTHDQSEALALSDRIAVMNKGKVVQIGTPLEIYAQPRSHFVADFIGTSNFISGRICAKSQASLRVESDEGAFDCSTSASFEIGQDVCISIRPEDVRVYRPSGTGIYMGNVIEGTVDTGIYVGDARDYQFTSKKLKLRARVSASELFNQGDRVAIELPADKCVVLPSES